MSEATLSRMFPKGFAKKEMAKVADPDTPNHPESPSMMTEEAKADAILKELEMLRPKPEDGRAPR